MNVKKRILAIQLAEKIQQNPEYAKKIGVSIEIMQKTRTNPERGSRKVKY